MTRDLSDLMWGAVSERSQSLGGLVPADGDRARLRARVRRGRTVRHVREVAVALPVAAAVGAAGWFGVSQLTGPTPPAVTPVPVEPTPTSSPTPEDTDEVVLGDPIDEPGLPTYYAMPVGLLDTVGDGWVVTAHRPARYGPGDEYVAVANALFLVAPDGTHYLAGRFELDATVYPVAWSVGSPTVDVVADVVTAGYADERAEQDLMPATYDLRTGTFAPREGDATWPPPDDGAITDGGAVVSSDGYGDTFRLWGGDQSYDDLAYGVPGKDCAPVGWLDGGVFLALCVDDGMPADASERDHHPVLYRAELDGTQVSVGELRALSADDPLPRTLDGVRVRVGEGAVAFPSIEGGPYGCFTGVDAWVGGELVQVQGPGDREENFFTAAAVGSRVYVQASPGCSGDAQPATLTAHDLASGASVLLAPVPADWRPGEDGWVTTGLVAWVVAQ